MSGLVPRIPRIAAPATRSTPRLRVEFRGKNTHATWLALDDAGLPITELHEIAPTREAAIAIWTALPPAKCACAAATGALGSYFAYVAVDPANGRGFAQCWSDDGEKPIGERQVSADVKALRAFVRNYIGRWVSEGNELSGLSRGDYETSTSVTVLRPRKRGAWDENFPENE